MAITKTCEKAGTPSGAGAGGGGGGGGAGVGWWTAGCPAVVGAAVVVGSGAGVADGVAVGLARRRRATRCAADSALAAGLSGLIATGPFAIDLAGFPAMTITVGTITRMAAPLIMIALFGRGNCMIRLTRSR